MMPKHGNNHSWLLHAKARALATLERFIHIEATSGLVLLIAAIAAIIWANSPAATQYAAFVHTPMRLGFGDFELDFSVQFFINDILMTIFFLVVGMEIRREIHEGTLSSIRVAITPVAAACCGVIMPALVFWTFNTSAPPSHGWAVPTATDIAFAVGMLMLLGHAVPTGLRAMLLALAVIDDLIAILIIAVFYSGGLAYEGLLLVAFGILIILLFHKLKIEGAWWYLLPGVLIWAGLVYTNVHPTLAGVILGLMTPIHASRNGESWIATSTANLQQLERILKADHPQPEQVQRLTKSLQHADQQLIAPVTRMQAKLHPLVAFLIMPLFALTNAGINFSGVTLNNSAEASVLLGVTLGLVLGKPIGIMLCCLLLVKTGIGKLPTGVNWDWLLVLGLLAGIGFTMSIFIANLAFVDARLLAASKAGILIASVLACLLGLVWGWRCRLKYA